MQNKIIIPIIVVVSIFSGILGSFIFFNFISTGLTQNTTTEIIKDGTYTNISDLENNITDLVGEVGPSVVNIIISKDLSLYKRDPFGFFQEKVGTVTQEVGGGSGFFISKDGIILTNKHVVSDSDASYTVITNTGEEYEAEVLATDELNDLAVIKIKSDNTNFPAVKLRNEDDEINIGQFAIAIGNALGEFQNSVALGVVSGKNRSIEAGDEYKNSTEKLNGLLQTDAAINPGNSGGPLINLKGEVMGINTAIAGDAQGLGFSIPLSQKKIDYIIESITKYGEIKRPFLGINYGIVTEQIAAKLGLKSTYGAYIPSGENSIIEGSAADNAGLEVGDIILEIDGNIINGEKNIQDIIQNKIPGDVIKLKVMKSNGKTKDIDLTLGEY